jgi:hypothetical protein
MVKIHISIAPENDDLSLDFGVDVPDKYFKIATEAIRVVDAVKQAIVNIKWDKQEGDEEI